LSKSALVLQGDVWPTGRSRITRWCLRARSGAWLFLSALKPMGRDGGWSPISSRREDWSFIRQKAGASRHFFYCHEKDIAAKLTEGPRWVPKPDQPSQGPVVKRSRAQSACEAPNTYASNAAGIDIGSKNTTWPCLSGAPKIMCATSRPIPRV